MWCMLERFCCITDIISAENISLKSVVLLRLFFLAVHSKMANTCNIKKSAVKEEQCIFSAETFPKYVPQVTASHLWCMFASVINLKLLG